jgi:hypothetical protein
MPFLVVIYKGKRLSMKVDEQGFIIGRAEDAQLILPEQYVSRHHARITFDGTGYVVEDLNSRNGTRLNNTPIPPDEPQPLHHEDMIGIGTVEIRFVDSLDWLQPRIFPTATGEVPGGEIFICHSSTDDAFVDQLAGELLARGPITTWVDHQHIEPGKDWDAEVAQALQKTIAMIVVLGAEAVESPNTRAEWSYFLDARKPVFPVLTEPCEVPYRLRIYQILDFQHNMDAIPGLLDAIWDVLKNHMPRQDENVAQPDAAAPDAAHQPDDHD